MPAKVEIMKVSMREFIREWPGMMVQKATPDLLAEVEQGRYDLGAVL